MFNPDLADKTSGTVWLFQGSESTLSEIMLGETIVQDRFTFTECDRHRARIVYRRGEQQVSLLMQRVDEETWATIGDAPPGMAVPRWRLVAVEHRASLDPALSGRTLTYDTTTAIGEAPNDEVVAMFDADQTVRSSLANADDKQRTIMLQSLSISDRRRKARIMEIVKAGELRTGADYYRAAMILQHGDVANDYLLAHHFAVISLSKGYDDAGWLAAATLDRFLLSIGRAQVYGTQWNRGESDGKFTYALPYDQDFISTGEKMSLRAAPPPE